MAAPLADRASGWMRWSFVAPVLALLIAFNVFPLVYNLVLGFTDRSLDSQEWAWVGERNYANVFKRARFADALRTTGIFVGCAVAIELALGFVLALCLKGRSLGRTVAITVLLVPMLLSPAVMGLFWRFMLEGNYGIVNQGLAALGVSSPPQWLTDEHCMLPAVIAIDVWMWTPFMMLIALAGLNSIPGHLYEAAEIDRASRWTVFRRITLPLCAPLLGLAVLLRVTDALKQFDIVMAVYGKNRDATKTLSVQLYDTIFSGFKVGLGSAYGVTVLVVVIALATVCTRYLDGVARRQGRG